MPKDSVRFIALLTTSLFTGACGSEQTGAPPASMSEGEAGAAGAPSTAGSAGSAGGDATSALDAPDEEQALIGFLESKQYASWAKESDYHPSTGPHGDRVRVYYSRRAAQTLSDGNPTFPAGAAAVKELTSDTSLYGWAVWVKVQADTDAGNGFFWYERIAQGAGNYSIYGNARGSADCVGCHQPGKDYNLSTFPFE